MLAQTLAALTLEGAKAAEPAKEKGAKRKGTGSGGGSSKGKTRVK